MSAPWLLSTERLSVSFPMNTGMAHAVREVDLRLAAGQTLALVGESGCGKTVTALALMGLLPPVVGRAGRVLWHGEDLLGANPERLRALRGRHLAMVFQEPAASLNPVYTVGEQVAEVLRYRRGLTRAQASKRALKLLRELKLPDAAVRASAYPHQLSGGMQQRVVLAAALAGDPELLIADEPTTALDVTVQAEILNLLRHQQRSRGMAMMFITHDLALVPTVADRIAVMLAGRIIERGPPCRVLAAPAHPYTRALVQSLPELLQFREAPQPIPDPPLDTRRFADGCPYAPRCDHAQPQCLASLPAEISLGSGHRVLCLPAVSHILVERKVLQ